MVYITSVINCGCTQPVGYVLSGIFQYSVVELVRG